MSSIKSNDLNLGGVCNLITRLIQSSTYVFWKLQFYAIVFTQSVCVFVCHDKLKMMVMNNLIGIINLILGWLLRRKCCYSV